MSSFKKYFAFALVLVMLAATSTACMTSPAQKPVPYGTNVDYRTYTNRSTTPYTAQDNVDYNKKVGGNDATMTGDQTSSLFATLDNSYANILKNTNVRSAPNAGSNVVGNLKIGDQVKVIGKLNGWYVVNVPNTNKVGCVSPAFIQLYSARPGTTAPSPTKPLPTTPNNPTGTNNNTTGKTPGATGTSTPTGSGTLSAQGSRILQLVNAERAKVGAKPLKSNADLNKLATMKSQDMVEKNYFSHQSPTYGSPFDMMKTYGVSYMYAGENIAINSDADKVHQAWMNSEGHRKNILNPDFTEIGIGLYPKGNGQYAYTQQFIGK
jgi:uncharacterized YkwD family protein